MQLESVQTVAAGEADHQGLQLAVRDLDLDQSQALQRPQTGGQSWGRDAQHGIVGHVEVLQLGPLSQLNNQSAGVGYISTSTSHLLEDRFSLG